VLTVDGKSIPLACPRRSTHRARRRPRGRGARARVLSASAASRPAATVACAWSRSTAASSPPVPRRARRTRPCAPTRPACRPTGEDLGELVVSEAAAGGRAGAELATMGVTGERYPLRRVAVRSPAGRHVTPTCASTSTPASCVGSACSRLRRDPGAVRVCRHRPRGVQVAHQLGRGRLQGRARACRAAPARRSVPPGPSPTATAKRSAGLIEDRRRTDDVQLLRRRLSARRACGGRTHPAHRGRAQSGESRAPVCQGSLRPHVRAP
jgi:hypothetical protein